MQQILIKKSICFKVGHLQLVDFFPSKNLVELLSDISAVTHTDVIDISCFFSTINAIFFSVHYRFCNTVIDMK